LTVRERRPRRRRNPLLVWGLALGAAVVVFAIGVAFGQALEENRGGGETQTSIRTLQAETLPAQTVTVTVPAP
jgi:hypothetical protein